MGSKPHLASPFAAVVRGSPTCCVRNYAGAIREAGMPSGPVLHVATTVTFAWGAWRLVGTAGALRAAAMFFIMSVSSVAFDARSFDYHSRHVFLSALIPVLADSCADETGACSGAALFAGGVAAWASGPWSRC